MIVHAGDQQGFRPGDIAQELDGAVADPVVVSTPWHWFLKDTGDVAPANEMWSAQVIYDKGRLPAECSAVLEVDAIVQEGESVAMPTVGSPVVDGSLADSLEGMIVERDQPIPLDTIETHSGHPPGKVGRALGSFLDLEGAAPKHQLFVILPESVNDV
jgi:hypothetical protein